jgi:hypothetical protein
VATAQARTTPPAYRLRPRGSRSRTPSTGLIPTLIGPETIARMNNWRRTSKQSGHPFRNRQQTRPVTAGGSPLFATPRRYLRRLSASPAFGKKAPLTNLCNQTSCQYGHPVKPPVSGTVSGLRQSDRRFWALPCHPHCLCELGATPSTSTPVNRFWRCTRPRMVPRMWGAACTSYDHRLCFPV